MSNHVSRALSLDKQKIDGSAWIAWRLLFGRGPWRQGFPLRGGEAALDAMVRVQNLVAHAIQALPQVSGVIGQKPLGRGTDRFYCFPANLPAMPPARPPPAATLPEGGGMEFVDPLRTSCLALWSHALRSRMPAPPKPGMRLASTTTAKVITSMMMPSTAMAPRSPLSLRSKIRTEITLVSEVNRMMAADSSRMTPTKMKHQVAITLVRSSGAVMWPSA